MFVVPMLVCSSVTSRSAERGGHKFLLDAAGGRGGGGDVPGQVSIGNVLLGNIQILTVAFT